MPYENSDPLYIFKKYLGTFVYVSYFYHYLLRIKAEMILNLLHVNINYFMKNNYVLKKKIIFHFLNVNVLNVWLNRRQLDSHIFCLHSVVMFFGLAYNDENLAS